jgi:hypothetical protein
MPRPLRLLAILLPVAASGCMSEDFTRHDGVTFSAGNAIAANSVMQMVDPWQRGVEDPHLVVPAERPQKAEQSDDADNSSVTMN